MYKLEIYKSRHSVINAEENDLITKLEGEFPEVLRVGIGTIKGIKGQ